MKSNLQMSNGGRILVVFSDRDKWRDYSCYFAEEGIDVDVVNSAETAMEKVRDTDYDIIIVEDHLPDSTGNILVARIFKEKMSMIFMIGKSLSDMEVVHAYRMGITDYLTFDIPAIRLAAKCRSVIDLNRVWTDLKHKQWGSQKEKRTEGISDEAGIGSSKGADGECRKRNEQAGNI